MAKVSFAKFGAKVNNHIEKIIYSISENESIEYEVKKYLPIKDKMELITSVVNQSLDSNGFINPIRVDLYLKLEIMYAYTNLNFTDKMKEDPFKLYDIIMSNDIFNSVLKIINEEYLIIEAYTYEILENIYNYQNSVAGMIKNAMSDYSETSLDLEAIQNQIKDPESFALLQQILNITNQGSIEA